MVECPLTVHVTQRTKDPIHINSKFYIEQHIIPALKRVFDLCGADVSQWYNSMTKPIQKIRHINYDTLHDLNISSRSNQQVEFSKQRQPTMESFLKSEHFCRICNGKVHDGNILCEHCKKCDKTGVAYSSVLSKLMKKQQDSWIKEVSLHDTCLTCARQPQQATLFCHGTALGEDNCSNIDCKVMQSRCKNILDIEDSLDALLFYEKND